MRLAFDSVVQDFIVSNGKIAQGYFDLSGKIIDSLCDSHTAREAVLMRLLEQAQTVTSHYLNAHQQVVQGLYLNQQGTADAPLNSPALAVAPLSSLGAEEASTPASNTPMDVATPAYEQWLRNEISAISGVPAADLDLHQRFDSLGLDSLSRVDLFDALGKAFALASEHASVFFDLATPAAVMALLEGGVQPAPASTGLADDVHTRVLAHLAAITGFALAELDPHQAFEEQGLDSLIRLDFLDLLSQEWPSLKAHESSLGDARCAQQTIDQIVALLTGQDSPCHADAPLSHDALLQQAMTPLLCPATDGQDTTRPFAELGFNGFDRAALCQTMADSCKTSEFAGEALMSRRSPEEALALLARMN